MNLVWDTVFTSEYCMVQYSLVNLVWVQYSLVNLVWVQYSLVNIVWGAVFTSKYCMGYSIHCMVAMVVQYSLGGTLFTSE